MPGWILTDTHPTLGRTFQRPLDPIELSYLLDSGLSGTVDCLHHTELRLFDVSQDTHLFSDTNIIKAWLSTKRRHPLAGAAAQLLPEKEQGDGITSDNVPTARFTVRERDLTVLRPNEIIFGHVASAEEVQQRMTAILSGPRPLSDKLLFQLYVFRETDRTDFLHLVTFMPHCITDGMANRTVTRCLLDSLARGGDPDSEPLQIPLEKRLSMVVPSGDLEPLHVRIHNLARQRWRRAVARLIFQMRMAKQGGHTLPCRLTHNTRDTPAQSGFISMSITEAQTTTMLANCRRHGLTFGHAYFALAQVAMTRVLYRRYLRGEISEEEWAYRKRQPYRTLGPLNLRPYLDREWYEKGGGGEIMLSISMYMHELPFMTLGVREAHEYHEMELSDGAPPFSDLLSFDRFLYRAGLVKKQAKEWFSHPLFPEIVYANAVAFLGRSLEQVKRLKATNDDDTRDKSDEEVLAVPDIPSILAHTGASLGNLQLILPTEYPLPPTHPLSPFSSVPHPVRAGYVTAAPTTEVDSTPKIIVENAMSRLQVRPGMLYLGALTLHGRLRLYTSFDGNVYEEVVVKEWVSEVRDALLWYLGQEHRSGRDQRGLSHVKGDDRKL